MRPSLALEKHREAVRAAVNSRRAQNPRVFGSASRGDDREDSDLDILIDALPETTMFDLGGLQMDLEEILGVRVDLLTPEDLPRRIRAKVVSEAIPI